MMLGGEGKGDYCNRDHLCGTLQKAGGLKKDNPTGDAEKGLRPRIEAPGDREVYQLPTPTPTRTWFWAKPCLSRTKTLQGGKSC